MKKVLLGSTALVAFGLMAAPASAQLELAITGSVDVHFGYGDDDFDANERDYGGTTDTILNFNADGVADNGLSYGGRINVDDSGNEFRIDETWVYLSGNWGEVRLGAKEGQAQNLRLTMPTTGNGQTDGDFGRYIQEVNNQEGLSFLDEQDDTKISYIGNFADFTFGVSYSPTTGANDSGANPQLSDDDAGEFENVFSAGANYQGDFGAATFGVSAGIASGDAELGSEEDLFEYGFGAEVGYAGFTFGGFYINSEGGTIEDRDRYGLGVSWGAGPWGFAVNGMYAEADLAGAGNEREDYSVGAGLSYVVAPGLTAYGDLVYFDYDGDGTAADNEGYVGLVGVTAAF
ncbi:MAG: porin [Inquilinaceae bacterium]